MEMFSFTLGILLVVALIMVGVLILGMVKVVNLQRNLERSQQGYNLDRDGIYREFEKRDHDCNQQFDRIYRVIEEVRKETESYVDRRIDKTINTLKES